MSKIRVWGVIVIGVLVFGLAGRVEAQWTRADTGWCEEQRGNDDRDRVCFALEREISDPGRLTVDGGTNGGVSVEGWNRDVVSVRAKVWANARSTARAEELAEQVSLSVRDGRLSADGPDTERREGWGVSWEIMVPADTDLEIETHNGGIGVTGVSGRIEFSAVNGGVHLAQVAGEVEGRTTNGGLHVELDGSNWTGAGLDVETTNGGISLMVPSNYSARLETGTVNGGIDIDFPITVQGRLGRRLSTTLGEGGALIRAVTTNGGVRIQRSRNSIR